MIAQKSELTTRLEHSLKRKATRRRVIRYSLIAANVAVLAMVVGFVFFNSRSDTLASASTGATQANAANPVDRKTSYDIAAAVANITNLPEAPVINGQVFAEKVQAQSAGAGAGAGSVIAVKPQIVDTSLKSNRDIVSYQALPGDTVSSLAAKYKLSASSIKWSNGLSGDALPAGKALFIPPVEGIVYTVKAGDTPDSLAQTYSVNRDIIVASNDAELKGIFPGERILIPGATMPTPSYGGFGLFGSFANVAGNYSLYARNNCTWWVAYRWAQTGHPIMPLLGNASQWYSNAQRAGLAVGREPRQGAAASNGGLYGVNTRGWGHVVYIEGVNSDGSVNISEMNVDGWASSRVWRSTVPAATASSWYYIYP